MALTDLIKPQPSTEPPPGVTCSKYARGEGKRCLHYLVNGGCALPGELMCSEWVRLNERAAIPAPPSALTAPESPRSAKGETMRSDAPIGSRYSDEELGDIAHAHENPEYIRRRTALIPRAETLADKSAGPEPEAKSKQHPPWAAKWNKALHEEMDRLVAEVGA